MIALKISRITTLAEDIRGLTLVRPDGGELPSFAPGAHIDLRLSDDLVRQYSLINDGAKAPSCYQVGVARDPHSRGGSAFVHDHLSKEMEIRVSAPRNHFPLVEDARNYVFIAGGIGITPIYAMARWCAARGKSWKLAYATRTAGRCAFRDELRAFGQAHLHHDDEGKGVLDLAPYLETPAVGTHLFCCGPQPLMTAVKDATANWPVGSVHFEWFSAPAAASTANEPFEVVLHRSGQRLSVRSDQTLLAALRDAGVPIASVCAEGVCGTCETPVIAGEIDHRDQVLTEDEKATGKTMMVCCSRSRGTLVLDL
ncbi:MAG: oxidoreductase [Proteobacteria bacterium]|nr:oxidoreductase [Pseudomonadota bacterium]